MLRRKFYKTLTDWRKNKKRECLLVKGARQTGKTFIIDLFGRENYGSYIYINFFEEPRLKNVFEGSLSAAEIYKRLSVFFGDIHFKEKDTLIFLDEIQECPNARTALKFLAEDDKYDVIASGSLLGINYKEVASFPVGYEKQTELHSLDFEEFLWAVGVGDEAISYVRTFFDSREKVPPEINERMMGYLSEYMAASGVPAVGNGYGGGKHVGIEHEEQTKIDDA